MMVAVAGCLVEDIELTLVIGMGTFHEKKYQRYLLFLKMILYGEKKSQGIIFSYKKMDNLNLGPLTSLDSHHCIHEIFLVDNRTLGMENAVD